MGSTARKDVLLVIQAKETASKAVEAATDALERLFAASGDIGDGAKLTGGKLQGLVSAITAVEGAYSRVDGAVNKADGAFNRQQAKLAETRAQLASVKGQIEGIAKAIETAQAGIVSAKLGESPLDRFGNFKTAEQYVAQIDAAKAALVGLQGQESRLTNSLHAQETAAGVARNSLQQLGSIANATEAALLGVGDTTRRAMLAATAATERETAALREQAAAARDEVKQREAQGRYNTLLGVRGPSTGAARDSGAAIEEQLRAIEAVAAIARSTGTIAFDRQAQAMQAIGLAAREVGIAEEGMAEKAARLRAQIDPLSAIQGNLNIKLKNARDLYRGGYITATELAAAERVLAAEAKNAADQLNRQGRGEHGKPSLFGLKPYELTNLGYQVNDVFTQLASGTSLTQTLAQQGGQLLQLFPRLGSVIVAALGNPAVLGGAAALGTVVMSIKRVFDEEARLRTFTGTLVAMGDGARYDAQALADTTVILDRFGMSADEAVAVVRRFLREGLNPALIEDFGRAAANMALVLGGDVTDAAQQIAEGFSGSYDSISRLDDVVNFLIPAEREHIRLLYESGRASEARAKAAKLLVAHMDEAAQKSRGPWEKAGRGLERVWNGLLTTLSKSAPVQKAAAFLGGIVALLEKIDDMAPDGGRGPGTSPGQPGAPNVDRRNADQQIADLDRRIAFVQGKINRLKATMADMGVSEQTRASIRSLIADMDKGLARLKQRRDALNADPVGPNNSAEQKRVDAIHAEELASLKVVELEQRLDEARRRGNAARSAAIAGEIEYQRVLNQTKDVIKAQAARNVAERQENTRTEAQQIQSGQALLRTANRYQGYDENNRNQRAVLMDMFRQAGIRIDPAKLAWCAAFINAVLAANGLPTAKGAGGEPTTRASDFKNYGSGVNLADAKPGDIIVLRPQARGTSGHVGLFSGFSENGGVRVTAGNQSGGKEVSTQTFGRGEVVAVRRPGLPDQDAAFLAQNEQQRLERQQQFNETLAEEAERRSRSVNQAKALLALSGEAYTAEQRRQAVDNAVWSAEQQAKRQALELTREQREEIERTAAAEWDAQNAREKAMRPVEELTRQRDALLISIKDARRAGEDGIADALEKDLALVDDALRQAIGSAASFWSQFSTAEANEALLGLGSLRDSLRRTMGEMHQARVDMIQEERQALLGRIATVREAGDTALADGLEGKLAEVDVKLKQAIDSAGAFWKAFDSPESRQARLGLAALRDDITRTQEQLRLDKMNTAVGQFQAQRSELQEMIGFYRSIGEMDVANALREDLRALDGDLLTAIDHLIEFWSVSTRPEAAATLLNLQNLRNQVIATGSEFRVTAGDIQQSFAGSLTDAVVRWSEAIGQGQNAIRATWDALRSFAADFLRQMGMMLLKAAALKLAMKMGFASGANVFNNMLNAAPLIAAGTVVKQGGDSVMQGAVALGAAAAALAISASLLMAANAAGGGGGGASSGAGGGFSGLAGSFFSSLFHSGGIAGSGNRSRAASPAWFTNAARYHGGGIAGLRPNEVPAILERGEEILTRNDSRHAFNGGGGEGGGSEPAINLKNVNVFDAADMLQGALSSRVGERVLINFVRRNASVFKAALD